MADTQLITLKFNGRDVQAKTLTQSQIIAVSASKFMGGVSDTTSRYFQIVRSRVGDQWDAMYDDILSGADEDGSFMAFFGELLRVSAEALKDPSPGPEQDDDAAALAEAMAYLKAKKAETSG